MNLAHSTRRQAPPPVCDFTRHAIALMQARGDPVMAVQIAASRWKERQLVAACIKSSLTPAVTKAAVSPGTTYDSSWAAPLAPPVLDVSRFIELLNPATILGRMIGMKPAVFNTQMPRSTAAAAMSWAGQGRPKVVSALAYDPVTIGAAKYGGIVVLSDALVRAPGAEGIVQQQLIDAIAQFADRQLLDPAVSAVLDVSPASLTNVAPSFASTGADATAVEADFKALVQSLNDNSIRFESPYFIMLPRTALHLATLRATDGTRIFPDVGAAGGDIWGISVLVTGNLPITEDSAAESIVVLLDAAEILLAEGTIELDTSKDASLQMDTDPGTGGATLVSLWQNNLVGLRAERFANWLPRHAGMCATLTGVGF